VTTPQTRFGSGSAEDRFDLTGTALAQETDLALLRGFYETMLRIRLFEERTGELVESKEVRCPCHLYIGQEAVAAGVCHALRREDYVWGTHRSHGHYLAKGGDMRAMMAEILGRVTGCSKGRGGSMHLFAPEVGIHGTVPLVAATIPIAVGTALASKIKKDGRVSVAFFGDGAVEEGHFHESVNMAAVYDLPVVFVCENNLYASHMSLLERRRKDNIDSAAESHGIPGVRLDGNDVVAVYRAALEAAERGRRGEGPTLIEARTYRWRGHVGPAWDIDVGVQRKNELGDWFPKDPIGRLRERLRELAVPAEELAGMEKKAGEEVEDALAFARQSPYPEPDDLLRHVFVDGSKIR
jgi:pyruvate dehydrogenase E1 component alpha subunit